MAGLMGRTMTIVKAKWNSCSTAPRTRPRRSTTRTRSSSAAPERQARHRRRRDREEAARAAAGKLEASVPKLDTQARRRSAGPRGPRRRRSSASPRPGAAPGSRPAGQQLEPAAGEARGNEKTLSAKIESFRSQKEVIKAQYSAAEAQVRIGEAATGIGDQMADTGPAIQRAKDKTEEMQARASAMDELIASGTLEDFTAGGETQLDRELAQLTSKSQVDDELAKMKAEIGAGSRRTEGDRAVARARRPLGRRRAAPPREGRDGRELAAARRRGGCTGSASTGFASTRAGCRLRPTRTAPPRRSSSCSAARASPGRTSRSTSSGPGTASSISPTTRSTRCAAAPTASTCSSSARGIPPSWAGCPARRRSGSAGPGSRAAPTTRGTSRRRPSRSRSASLRRGREHRQRRRGRGRGGAKATAAASSGRSDAGRRGQDGHAARGRPAREAQLPAALPRARRRSSSSSSTARARACSGTRSIRCGAGRSSAPARHRRRSCVSRAAHAPHVRDERAERDLLLPALEQDRLLRRRRHRPHREARLLGRRAARPSSGGVPRSPPRAISMSVSEVTKTFCSFPPVLPTRIVGVPVTLSAFACASSSLAWSRDGGRVALVEQARGRRGPGCSRRPTRSCRRRASRCSRPPGCRRGAA